MKLLVLTQSVNSADPVLGFFCGWLRALARRVERVAVVALEERTHSLPANVQVHSAGRERGQSRHVTWLRLTRQIHQQLRDDPPDVILAHMCPEYVLAAAPFAWRRHIPMVLWYAHRGVSPALRLAHPLVRAVATSVQGGFPLASDKVQVIGQGIDVQQFCPAETDTASDDLPSVLVVGRLDPVKRYDVVLEAVRLLRRRDVGRFRLRIIGDVAQGQRNSYRDGLERLVHRDDLQQHVVFHGSLPPAQLAEAYRRCVCLVSASPGPDKVVFEAMACGVPVVVGNAQFLPLLNGASATMLFRAGDPSDLAEKLGYWLAADAGRRAAAGRTLRERVVAAHSVTHWGDQMHALLARASRNVS